MRSDLRTTLLALPLLCLLACDDPVPTGPPPGRFAAVKKDESSKAAAVKTFCEKTYPASGEGARSFARPAERPLPTPAKSPAQVEGGWRWVNLWATWCRPCTDEMPLLGRWRDTLARDGLPVSLELWSVDEEEEDLKGWLEKRKMPGAVSWLKDAETLGETLESFGVEKTSPIPVHVLVDAKDQIRCVRVGAVHAGDFGAVKTLLTSG